MSRLDKKGVMVYIPAELHKRFRARLVQMDLTQRKVIQDLVERFCEDVPEELDRPQQHTDAA